MFQAEQAAKRGTCSRLQVGAVVVVDHHVISTGYNGAPRGVSHCDHSVLNSPCNISVHAEANALIFAGYPIGDSFLRSAEMYITHAPCRGCAGLMINKGIERVYFREYYRSAEGLDILRGARVHCEQVQDQKG
jgi:dCMP deaminase